MIKKNKKPEAVFTPDGFFCGDTADCRDEFLELNKMQDVEEEG